MLQMCVGKKKNRFTFQTLPFNGMCEERLEMGWEGGKREKRKGGSREGTEERREGESLVF